MALRVRRSSSLKVRFITTLMMAAALVAQPFAGVLNTHTANAVETPEHVVINEVHPGGVNTPRWVELYNPTSSEVSLADWRITHDDVAKSYFGGVFGENVIIPAHGYYVQDDESGNPTLSLSGSTLHLQKALGAEDTDTLIYPALDAGQSYGHSPDATGTLTVFDAAKATPGEANYVKAAAKVAPTCTYDFQAEKMWEITWGYGFEDRNGNKATFNMHSNGGLVSLNGKAVPDYMTPNWHWLYVHDSDSQTTRHYDYGFADGTTRTADITYSDVNGCQTPEIVWGVAAPTHVTVGTGNGAQYATLQEGIDAVAPGGTVEVRSWLSIKSQVIINKPVTIDGGKVYTIYSDFTKSGNDNNAALGIIGASNVTLKDLTINGLSGPELHGINIYDSTNVLLDNVAVARNEHYGIVVNGSSVTANNVITVLNGWGGIDVDSNTGTPSVLTVKGKSLQNSETRYQIFVDDTAKGSVIDTDHQYRFTQFGNSRAYTLRPVDTTNSVATIDSLTEGQYVKDTVPVTITATDQNLEAYSYRIKNTTTGATVVEKAVASSEGVDKQTVFNWDTTNSANGQYYVYVSARDNAGNRSEQRVNVTVDNTKPTASLKTSSAGNIAQKTLRKADFSLHDNSKVRAYEINGMRVSVSPNAYSDANDIKVGARYGVYGKNTLTVEDMAGNVSEPFVFYLDNVAPTATLKDSSLGDGIQFRKVSYKLSDAYKVDRVIINGVEKDLTDNPYSDLDAIVPSRFGAKEGANTLVVYDVAGNTKEYEFTLDTTAPTGTVAFSNQNDSQVTKEDVIATLKTTEPIKTPVDWTGVNDTTFTRTYSTNGKYSVDIEDMAGNTNTVKYEIKRIDHTDPVINGVENGGLYNAPVSYTITEQSIATIYVDGTAYGEKNAPRTVSGDGEHTLEVVDKAGNTSGEVKFTIDTKAPEVKSLTYSPSSLTNKSVLVTLETDEPIDATALTGTWLKKSDTRYQKSYPVNMTQAVTLKDKAGNTSTVLVNIDWIDKDAPVITTPNLADNDELSGVKTIEMDLGDEKNPLVYNIRVLKDGQVVKDLNGKNMGAYDANNHNQSYSYDFDTTQLLNGTYKIQFSAKDGAGNGATPVFRTVVINNTVATPTVVSPAADGATVKSAGYVVRGQAPGAKAVYVCVTPKESAAVSVLEVSQGDCHEATLMADGSWSSDISSFLSDKKSYALSFYAQDAAGNKSESVARTISVDNTEKASSDGSGSTNDGTKNETADKKDQPVVTPQRSTGNSPTSSPNLLAVNSFQATANQPAADDVAVLGAETTKNDDTSADDAAVLGESDTAAATAAQTPAKGASTIFGLAWYWWLVVLAVIASILYAVARRRNQNA